MLGVLRSIYGKAALALIGGMGIGFGILIVTQTASERTRAIHLVEELRIQQTQAYASVLGGAAATAGRQIGAVQTARVEQFGTAVASQVKAVRIVPATGSAHPLANSDRLGARTDQVARRALAADAVASEWFGDTMIVAVPIHLQSGRKPVGAAAIAWDNGRMIAELQHDLWRQSLWALVTALALLTLALIGIKEMIVLPVVRVTEQILSVRSGRSPTADVDRNLSCRKDEVGTLAREFDGMLRDLAKAQEDLLALSEAEIARKNQQLDAALGNMSQGLCMFDANHRLVLCNRRISEVYMLPSEIFIPGTAVSDLLSYLRNAGVFQPEAGKGDSERLAFLCEGQPIQHIFELRNGRTITVTHRPMTDGGWVCTHEDITERRQVEARIEYMAHHDALTDLPNRVLFRRAMELQLARAKRGDSMAVLCLDLDHFKAVNDTLGHPIGDALLKAVAKRLAECVREEDTVARLGGDEFAIIQVGAEQPCGATALARRIIEAIGRPYDIEGHHVVIGTSVGVVVAPDDGDTADQLLKNADLALYRAKADGRGTLRFFEPELDRKMQARRLLELDMRRALSNKEFELFYQPLINVQSREVAAFEALLRWRHPTRGMVQPNEFIPLAEETGLIVPIGSWVLREACREAARWPDPIGVSINISPIQFRSNGLALSVLTALTESGLEPSRLELEITEAVLLQDSEVTTTILQQLRDLGVRIAMDDFGTGYSSLNYLRKFPFDRIKVDRSFVKDLPNQAEATAIIRAVSGIGHSLGMATTAEGVESEEQLLVLQGEGYTQVQGYYFSPPRPACDVPDIIGRANDAMRGAA